MLKMRTPHLPGLAALIALTVAAVVLSGVACAQPPTSGCDLCQPAYDGDLAKVELLLEHGAKVEADPGLDQPAGVGARQRP